MTYYYHFVSDKLRDGRAIPADGEWLVHEGPLAICQSGLHASAHPADAIKYAPGNTLCLVELDGEIQHKDDKSAATRRKIVKRIDATALLREHARWCALQVVHTWEMPALVHEYLETGDNSLRKEAATDAYAAASAAYAAYASAYIDAYATGVGGERAHLAARQAQREHFQQLVDSSFAGVQSAEPGETK